MSVENGEQHYSIHETDGFDEYGNSPLSRSGLNKKSTILKYLIFSCKRKTSIDSGEIS